MANKNDNLLREDRHVFTHEEKVAGGIASGKARAERATLKKTLEALLDTIPKSDNNPDNKTFRELSTEGLMMGAIQGKAENFKLMCQLMGEFEEQQQSGTPQVNINIVDNTELEKALYEADDENNES